LFPPGRRSGGLLIVRHGLPESGGHCADQASFVRGSVFFTSPRTVAQSTSLRWRHARLVGDHHHVVLEVRFSSSQPFAAEIDSSDSWDGHPWRPVLCWFPSSRPRKFFTTASGFNVLYGHTNSFHFHPTLLFLCVDQFNIQIVFCEKEGDVVVLKCLSGFRSYQEFCSLVLQKRELNFQAFASETEVVKSTSFAGKEENR